MTSAVAAPGRVLFRFTGIAPRRSPHIIGAGPTAGQAKRRTADGPGGTRIRRKPVGHDAGVWRALRRRNARRAARAIRALPRTSAWQEAALEALGALLSASGPARDSLLAGPGFRSWLAAAEEAIGLLHPPRDDAALFARVAAGSHLLDLLPRGRLDAGFRRRAALLGRSMIDPLFRRLVPLLMFRTPPWTRSPILPVPRGASGEEARLAGELHAEWPQPMTGRLPAGRRVRLDGPSVRLDRGDAISWRPRTLLPSSTIVLARLVVSTPAGLRPSSETPRMLRPLEAALALLQRAWPEARRHVEEHTRVVIPLSERNTVSFSMTSRPAVSYINMKGKSLVDLADDLLHETAHHRLHLIEESGPLVRRAPREGTEVMYHSPWRRAPRPVRGILHATYTFGHRAELLARLLRLPAPAGLPRSWMRREMDFERRAIDGSLEDLEDAARRGLLTRRGMALCAGFARRFS